VFSSNIIRDSDSLRVQRGLFQALSEKCCDKAIYYAITTSYHTLALHQNTSDIFRNYSADVRSEIFTGSADSEAI
jgi:hypothetical protein